MASVFERAAGEVIRQAATNQPAEQTFLRKLDRRGRIVYGLFERQDEISARDVAQVLGLLPRQARELLSE